MYFITRNIIIFDTTDATIPVSRQFRHIELHQTDTTEPKREARRAGEIFESRYILLLNARELFRFFLFQLSRTYRIPLNAGLYHPRPHLAIFLRAPSSKLMEFINSVWLESATSLFLFKDGLLECPPMVQHPLTVERKLLVRSFFFIL